MECNTIGLVVILWLDLGRLKKKKIMALKEIASVQIDSMRAFTLPTNDRNFSSSHTFFFFFK